MTEEKTRPLGAKAKNTDYRAEMRELLENSDKVYGITSKFSPAQKVEIKGAQKTEYTSPEFQRNTSHTVPLGSTPPDQEPNLIRNNTLLKALSTLRGALHVLEQQPNLGPEVIDRLKDQFARFDKDVKALFRQCGSNYKELKKQLDQRREVFNQQILVAFKASGLLVGIEKNVDKQDQLLSYCRYLSGLLDPAPVVKTVITLPNGKRYVETCYPMTQKTEKQRKALLTAIPAPGRNAAVDTDTFYTKQPPYLQAVTCAFRNELVSDHTLMSPQLRKFIPHGLKNSFAVQREILPENSDVPENSMWSSRSATIAYLGAGESPKKMQEAADQNFLQLQNNLGHIISKKGTPAEKGKLKRLHITMLNTDTQDGEKQDRIVGMTKKASRLVHNPDATSNKWLNPSDFSYLPVNPEGRVHPNQIAPRYDGDDAKRYKNKYSLSRGKHPALTAAEVSVVVSRVERTNLASDGQTFVPDRTMVINHSACASGIDRTGTNQFLTSFIFLKECNPDLSEDQILDLLTQAGHCSVMAHITCPSSPGMKSDSKPGDLFGKLRNLFLYLKSADTNKYTLVVTEQANNAPKNKGGNSIRAISVFSFMATSVIIGLYWEGFLGATTALIGSGLAFAATWFIGLALIMALAFLFSGRKKRHLVTPLLFFGFVAAIVAIFGSVLGEGAKSVFISVWQSWTFLTVPLSALGPGFAIALIALAATAVLTWMATGIPYVTKGMAHTFELRGPKQDFLAKLSEAEKAGEEATLSTTYRNWMQTGVPFLDEVDENERANPRNNIISAPDENDDSSCSVSVTPDEASLSSADLDDEDYVQNDGQHTSSREDEVPKSRSFEIESSPSFVMYNDNDSDSVTASPSSHEEHSNVFS